MRQKILVVDDSSDIRALLGRILGTRYDVAEATTGEEALSRIDTFKPDLIILDIMMPGIDGFAVCENLRKQDLDIPVIFVSGKSESRDIVKGLESGAADYITKPFQKTEVIARVENQLKIRKLTCELKQANAILTRKQNILDEDMRAAAGIQYSLLPRQVPNYHGLKVRWKFIPSYIIGGDIFNIFRLDEEHVGFYMLDVSGHGVPSALIAVSVSQILKPEGIAKERIYNHPGYRLTSPKEIMEILDKEYPLERFDKYFTIVYFIINTMTGHFTYSNAAHPFPVITHEQGKMDILNKGGTIIGLDGIVPFEEGSGTLNEGDRIIIFTDGFIECRNKAGELFGLNRLYKRLESLKDKDLDTMLDNLISSIQRFSPGQSFEDDLTIVGIEYSQGFRVPKRTV